MPSNLHQTAMNPGRVIADTYRIVRQIGQGGMSTVYEVAHLRLPRNFALKIINIDSEGFTNQFRQEAEILAGLHGQHIVSILDWNILDDGRPYLVMELLSGVTLNDYIKNHEIINTSEAIGFIVQIGLALSEIHSAGIIHLDIKPSNIFLTKTGSLTNFVKVFDFGISKSDIYKYVDTDRFYTILTGTPGYMAPEQIIGGNSGGASPASDQFALAIIAYELITGRHPFYSPGAALISTLDHTLNAEPQPLSEHPLWPAIKRGLSKRAADRFPSVDAFVAALQTAASEPTANYLPSLRGGPAVNDDSFPEDPKSVTPLCRGREQSSGLPLSASPHRPLAPLHEAILRLAQIWAWLYHPNNRALFARQVGLVLGVLFLSVGAVYAHQAWFLTLLSATPAAYYLHQHRRRSRLAPVRHALGSAQEPSGQLPLDGEIKGFRIQKKLSTGATTDAYKAENRNSYPVVFHVLNYSSCQDAEQIQRFLNSAKAITALNAISHPNLTRFVDYDLCSDGTPYIITEYYPGETLQQKLASGVQFSDLEVLHIGTALANVLTVCHDQRIVHRGLSPHAVLLAEGASAQGVRFPHVKLLGFSMVKLMPGHAIADAIPVHTLFGQKVGIGIYMAPEQVAGTGEVDGKTDVFVLAMLLAELLLGRPVCPASPLDSPQSQYLVGDLFPLFRDADEPLRSLICTMTLRSPRSRPAMAEVHQRLTLLFSAKTAVPRCPQVSIRELSTVQFPERAQLVLPATAPLVEPQSPTPLTVRIPGGKGKLSLAAHMLECYSIIQKSAHEGSRRRLFREGLVVLPEDELRALCCDAFPELQPKFSANQNRTEVVSTILQVCSPDEAMSEILYCLGVRQKDAG